jgi:hypothetical protein
MVCIFIFNFDGNMYLGSKFSVIAAATAAAAAAVNWNLSACMVFLSNNEIFFTINFTVIYNKGVGR